MTAKNQRSLFEDGLLVRELGSIATQPDVALSELVANAWDAGATRVEICIPDVTGGTISVSDDGVGMTSQQFRDRWMRHGYSRAKHQGELAEFPPERADWRRKAYGRNGLGRHALLQFATQYQVETRRFNEEEGAFFVIEPSSGDSVFRLASEAVCARKASGTTVSATVDRLPPDVEAIRDALSFTFLHDPQFSIVINGEPLSLETHSPAVSEHIELDGAKATVDFFEIEASRRRKIPHGVAFWVGNRLVGEPSNSLQGTQLIDGRTTLAGRHLIVVKSDDLHDDVRPDWSGFKRSPRIASLGDEVGRCVAKVTSSLMAGKIDENKAAALRGNQEELRKLQPLAQIEITEFVENLIGDFPTLNVDILTLAVKAAVNLEKSRSGRELLSKLSVISTDDADRINGLLDNWTLRDALAVLDEIDRRVSIVAALEKLMDDPTADELHSIHPLITHARWLFGPEYDSPLYASNVTIKKAAAQTFKKRIDPRGITNTRQRPDLIFLKDATLSLTATESFNEDSSVVVLQRLLLIELKKGNSTIILKHINQAQQYVQDLLSCGLLDGSPTPFIQAFVVGHKVDKRLNVVRVGDQPSNVAVIEPCSFGQLVRTANHRLFRLQGLIAERYRDVPGLELVRKVLGEPKQGILFPEPKAATPVARKRKSRR
jgi:hypothetical protein